MATAASYQTTQRTRSTQIAIGFALYLHIAWFLAWVLERTLENRSGVLVTTSSRSVYWLVAKILLWVLPSLLVLRGSLRPLRKIVGLHRVREILLWGGGVGLALGSTALIAKVVDHRPLVPSEFGWPFFNAVFVSPVVEELAFRGVMLGYLKENHRFIVANLAASLLFLTIHMVGWHFQGRLMTNLTAPIGGALSIFLIGFVLGIVAHKSHYVAASTLTHLLNNLFNA